LAARLDLRGLHPGLTLLIISAASSFKRSRKLNHILNARERKALGKLSDDHRDYLIKGQLTGIGTTTLASLVSLGLAETGRSKRYYGDIGWRITPDGWRCMYGKTYEQIMVPGGTPTHALRVWSWPPSNR
jgi:hypothetical protein